ncbi:MAG: hypothetical protein WC738_00245 [Candidatus Omnitrophota bacterium]
MANRDMVKYAEKLAFLEDMDEFDVADKYESNKLILFNILEAAVYYTQFNKGRVQYAEELEDVFKSVYSLLTAINEVVGDEYTYDEREMLVELKPFLMKLTAFWDNNDVRSCFKEAFGYFTRSGDGIKVPITPSLDIGDIVVYANEGMARITDMQGDTVKAERKDRESDSMVPIDTTITDIYSAYSHGKAAIASFQIVYNNINKMNGVRNSGKVIGEDIIVWATVGEDGNILNCDIDRAIAFNGLDEECTRISLMLNIKTGLYDEEAVKGDLIGLTQKAQENVLVAIRVLNRMSSPEAETRYGAGAAGIDEKLGGKEAEEISAICDRLGIELNQYFMSFIVNKKKVGVLEYLRSLEKMTESQRRQELADITATAAPSVAVTVAKPGVVEGAAHEGEELLEAVREAADKMEATAGRLKAKDELAPKNLDRLVAALNSKHTPEDKEDIRKILELLAPMGFGGDIVSGFENRILLMDVGEKRITSEGGRLGAAIIMHNGVRKIVFPRNRLEQLRRLGFTNAVNIDQLTHEARLIVSDILHEIVEIGLRSQGISEDEAHYYARHVQNMLIERGVAAARAEFKKIIKKAYDEYRLAHMERGFSRTIAGILTDMRKNASDLDNLTEDDIVVIRDSFIAITRSQGDYLSAKFEKFIQSCLTKENLRNYIDKEKEKGIAKGQERHLDSSDLVLILQRLHAIASDVSKFYLTEEAVAGFGNSGKLGGLLAGTEMNAPSAIPTPAIEYEILKSVGLAGKEWDDLKDKVEASKKEPGSTWGLLEEWRKAAESGEPEEAAKYIEQIWNVFRQLKNTDRQGWLLNIRAVCDFFGIRPIDMARNSVLNWLIQCRKKEIVVERSAASKQKMSRKVREHFVYNGVFRILNACANPEVLKHAVITKFVGRGADGLAMIARGAVSGREDAVVKIITPERPGEENVSEDILSRRTAQAENRLNKIISATKNNPYFADNIAVFRIKYGRREDVVEIDRFVPNVADLKTLTDNVEDWNTSGARMLHIAAQIILGAAFLLDSAQMGDSYVDNDIDNLENFLVMPDGNVKLIDFSKIYTVSDTVKVNNISERGPQNEEGLRLAYRKRVLRNALRILIGEEGARQWGSDGDLIDNLSKYVKLFVDRYGQEYESTAHDIFLSIAALYMSRQNGVVTQLYGMGRNMEGEYRGMAAFPTEARGVSPIEGASLTPGVVTLRQSIIDGAAMHNEKPAAAIAPANKLSRDDFKIHILRQLQASDMDSLRASLKEEISGLGYPEDTLNNTVERVLTYHVGNDSVAYGDNDRRQSLFPQLADVKGRFKEYIIGKKNSAISEKKITLCFVGTGKRPLEILRTLGALHTQLQEVGENPADWAISVYVMDPRLENIPKAENKIEDHEFTKTLSSLRGKLKVDIYLCNINVFDGKNIQNILGNAGQAPQFIFFRNVLYPMRYYQKIINENRNRSQATTIDDLMNYLALRHLFSISDTGTIFVTEPPDSTEIAKASGEIPAVLYPGTTSEPNTGIYRIDNREALVGMNPDILRDYIVSHAAPVTDIEQAAKTRDGTLMIPSDKEYKYFNPATLEVGGNVICHYARRVSKNTDTSKPHKSDIVRLNPGMTETELIAEKEVFVEGAEDPRIMKIGESWAMTFTMPDNNGSEWHTYFVYLNEDGTRETEIRRLGNPTVNSKNAYIVQLENGRVAVIDRADEPNKKSAIQVYMFDSLDKAFEACADKDAQYWKDDDHTVFNSTIMSPGGDVHHIGFNTIICALPERGKDVYLAFTHKAKSIEGADKKKYVTAVAILHYNPASKRLEFSGRPVELPQPQADLLRGGDVGGVVYETATAVINVKGVQTVVSYAGINDAAIARFEMPLAELLQIYQKGQEVAPASKAIDPLEKFDEIVGRDSEFAKDANMKNLREVIKGLAAGDARAIDILETVKYVVGVMKNAKELLKSTNVPDKPVYLFIPSLSPRLCNLANGALQNKVQSSWTAIRNGLNKQFRIGNITVTFYDGTLEQLRDKIYTNTEGVLTGKNTVIYIDGNTNEKVEAYEDIAKQYFTVRDVARDGGNNRSGYLSIGGHIALGLGILELNVNKDPAYYAKVINLLSSISYKDQELSKLTMNDFMERLKKGDIEIILPPIKEEDINGHMREFVTAEEAAMKSL